MSDAPTDTEVAPAAAAQATAVAARLPFVQFSSAPPSAGPRVQVYYNEYDAVGVAGSSPDDDFYDADGHALTPFQDTFHVERMAAAADADPDEVKRRLIAEMRAGIERASLSADAAAAADAVAVWIEASPSLEQAVHGCGLVSPVYVEHMAGGTTPCTRCNAFQRIVWAGTNKCC